MRKKTCLQPLPLYNNDLTSIPAGILLHNVVAVPKGLDYNRGLTHMDIGLVARAMSEATVTSMESNEGEGRFSVAFRLSTSMPKDARAITSCVKRSAKLKKKKKTPINDTCGAPAFVFSISQYATR